VFAVGANRPGSDELQSWYAHEACLTGALHPDAMFDPRLFDEG
jgi:hypothetical protein